MQCTTVWAIIAAVATMSACGGTDPSGSDGGPDFTRALEPGEYQVKVTGDVERSFEATGARYYELGAPPFSGFDRAELDMMPDTDALNGAAFDLCSAPSQPGTYGFDATTAFAGCPSGDPTRVTGGFIIQLGAPQADELDCYANGYGEKDLDGTLTITAVTESDIQGDVQGSGVCSRHPHSEVEPMQSETVSVRVRFRAVKGTP